MREKRPRLAQAVRIHVDLNQSTRESHSAIALATVCSRQVGRLLNRPIRENPELRLS
jgi:hypothetical protein